MSSEPRTSSSDKRSSFSGKEDHEELENANATTAHGGQDFQYVDYHYVADSPEEQKLRLKLDLHLLPTLWIMYVINYLDRSNIGNAKVGGMEKDLNLSSNDYSLALLIFFVGYLLMEVPSNMILAKVRPSLYLPGIMFVWGCVVIAFKGVHNLKGLVAIRFFLGIAESGFFPGVWFFLGSWYKREELSKRFAIFYSASIISGAFGGLLAGVITENLDGKAGTRGWQWLFVVEGLATVTFAVIATFILPDWPETTKWLTPEERVLAVHRLKVQYKADEHLSHKESLKLAVSDWRTWAFVVCYMCIAGAGTISYFIPTIASELGYKGRQAQYMSASLPHASKAPPYAVAFVLSLSNNFHADWTRERIFHIAVPLIISGISYIVIAVVTHDKVRYAFLCFGASGVWSALPVMLAYASECLARPASKRAVAVAIINSLGNLSSVYGSYLWPATDKPKYEKGFGVTCAFCFLAAFMVFVIRFFNGPIKTLDEEKDARGAVEKDPEVAGPTDDKKASA
ncbi:MFS general substrate transporter [Atractiella rhizophila]|nr:MFS general substrate transporter [Atractiella rhizophila]